MTRVRIRSTSARLDMQLAFHQLGPPDRVLRAPLGLEQRPLRCLGALGKVCEIDDRGLELRDLIAVAHRELREIALALVRGRHLHLERLDPLQREPLARRRHALERHGAGAAARGAPRVRPAATAARAEGVVMVVRRCTPPPVSV